LKVAIRQATRLNNAREPVTWFLGLFTLIPRSM
jgi:hypothetical protein